MTGLYCLNLVHCLPILLFINSSRYLTFFKAFSARSFSLRLQTVNSQNIGGENISRTKNPPENSLRQVEDFQELINNKTIEGMKKTKVISG